MKKHRAILFIGCVAVMLVTLIGCSKELIVDSNSTTGGSGVTAYFPLSSGFTTRFQVHNSSGDSWIENFTIGGNSVVQNVYATMRLKQSSADSDTGYFSTIGDGLYYFATTAATGEKILELPLTVGQSWQRIATSGSDTGGTNPDTTGGGGGINAPGHFPTTGSNIMTVSSVETITLNNGLVFSGAVQICTSAGNGTQNQYWFAPGVGLVKYILGSTGYLSTADGQEVGELVDYWR